MSTLKLSDPATTEVDRRLSFDWDGREPDPEKHPDTSTTSLKHIRFEILCMYHTVETTYISDTTA